MIHIAILRVDTVLLVDQVLNHGWLHSARDIQSDVLDDLVVGYEVAVLDL